MSSWRPTDQRSDHGRTARGARLEAAFGYTLLELILVLSLLAIFIGTVYESIILGLRVVSATDTREELRERGLQAFDRLTRELSIASKIHKAEDQEVEFDADVDGDGKHKTKIRYRVNNGTLERLDPQSTVTLVWNLAAFDLDYLDSANTHLATPVSGGSTRDTIRVVEVTGTLTKANETLSLATSAFVRNNR